MSLLNTEFDTALLSTMATICHFPEGYFSSATSSFLETVWPEAGMGYKDYRTPFPVLLRMENRLLEIDFMFGTGRKIRT